MPTALQIAAQVTVDAEPERVWQAAVDWPRQREWIWGTRVHGGRLARWGLRSSLRRFARLLLPR